VYAIYLYKIVLYVCAIYTVLIIVSDNSVKNGSLIYCFMCVLWPVIERWDLSKILNWIDWITKCVEVCSYIIKRKNIYHTVGTVPAFNRAIVEICKFAIPIKFFLIIFI
jgi:hypothetical protein